jgi:hypothetical protein
MNDTQHLEARPAALAETLPASWRGHMADQVGATFGPDAVAQLSASSDELQLTGALGSFTLPKSTVKRISGGRMYPWFFRAVRIRATWKGTELDIQFKPMDASHRAVIQRLHQLGYA